MYIVTKQRYLLGSKHLDAVVGPFQTKDSADALRDDLTAKDVKADYLFTTFKLVDPKEVVR